MVSVGDGRAELAGGAGASSTVHPLRLDVECLGAGYDGRDVVSDVSLAVASSEIVILIGHNGAGKSTTLKAMAGLLAPSAGRVDLGGADLTHEDARTHVEAGLVYLPQERAVFRGLSVRENLRLGGALERDNATIETRIGRVVDLFPLLGERMNQPAGTLSGGQQRMVSIGIALMADARILLLDEPSLGLAPVVYEEMLNAVERMVREAGVGVVIVEQVIGTLARRADRVYVLRSGTIVRTFSAGEARRFTDWMSVF